MTAAAVGIDLDLGAGPGPGRAARRPVVTGTATFLALLAVVAVLTRGVPRTPAARDADAAGVLRAAATAVEESPGDGPAPGQARLITVRQFTLDVTPGGNGRSGVIGTDRVVEEWVPADADGVWLQRTRDAVTPQLLDERAHAYVAGGPSPATEARGRCGDYFPAPGRDPCGRPGLWPEPTPAFVAGLPRDPRALLTRLRADTADTGADRGQETLLAAAQALDRGLLPADVQAAVYRALALLPGLRTARQTLDGRSGVAVGLVARGAWVGIVVAPGTGAYLGRHRTLTASRDGLPAGTVTDATSVRSTVVSAVGRHR